MRQIERDPIGFCTLFEHEGEQRWIPDLDLEGGTAEEAWALWTPATEVHRQGYLRRAREFMQELRLTARAMAFLGKYPELAKLLGGPTGVEEK